IIFTSQVGKGSVFGFTLPIKSEAPANSLPANNSIQDPKEADKPLTKASDKEKDKPNGTID
ncbi:MAG: hypothetical protein WCG30_03670, partial [Candidatus Saccharibacteria bacterium]